MGRYTTVQTFADNNPSMRSIPYDQAAGKAPAPPTDPSADASAPATAKKPGRVIVERVVNPYGSTAGAGSGEFHVYRAARAREQTRLRAMDAADIARIADAEHLAKEIAGEEALGRAAAKRKRKRDRQRTAKRRAAVIGAGGLLDGGGGEASDGGAEDFEYTPLYVEGGSGSGGGCDGGSQKDAGKGGDNVALTVAAADGSFVPDPKISNDGTFLETMRRSLAAASAESSAPLGIASSLLDTTASDSAANTVDTTAAITC
mmetsp:Transcript_34746/g.68362  ORF Transcript_34746/g.68362 Transcript_34746/m.68362 type:complete len:260 (-) Transcript_34746:86-865(-)